MKHFTFLLKRMRKIITAHGCLSCTDYYYICCCTPKTGEVILKNLTENSTQLFKRLSFTDFSKTPINYFTKVKDPKLKEITQFLDNNLDQNIMLSDLAQRFDINERSLHRLFKKDTNISFIKFFTIIRMYKAIDYLSQKKYSISEIASKVGYSSIPTFSNTFYKVIGKRPSDYQRGRNSKIIDTT